MDAYTALCHLAWKSGFQVGQPCVCILPFPSNPGGASFCALGFIFCFTVWYQQGVVGLLHMIVSPHQLPPSPGWVSLLCAHSSTLLVLLPLWALQLLVHSAVPHSRYMASHTCVPCCSTCPLSKQGLGRPTMQDCISMPCYLWVEQPCICTQSLVVNSVHSVGGVSLHVPLSASGNPACGYCKVLLALHFSQGSPMCMHSCTYYLCTFSGGAVLPVGSAAFC